MALLNSFKEEYLAAIDSCQYDKLIEILMKNLIQNFDYKSVCDLGTYLCDADDSGLTIKLSRDSCEQLGKNLLLCSYYNQPDICNALALQLVCLERSSDYKTVADMAKTAIPLNDCFVTNNIAYSEYKLGRFDRALELQRTALKTDNEKENKTGVIYYNLMLYDLFCNNGLKQEYNWSFICETLISDYVFDYESAMVLAAYFDDYAFVEKNYDYFKKTFICGKKTMNILKEYLSSKSKPDIKTLSDIVQPQTCYGKCFYLTQ